MFRMSPFPPELWGSPGALPWAPGALQHRGQRRGLGTGILLWKHREKTPKGVPAVKILPPHSLSQTHPGPLNFPEPNECGN